MAEPQTLIAVHHVGGRGGTGALRPPAPFAGDVVEVTYDADAACTTQMAEAGAPAGRLTVLPMCLGRTTGEAPFHITYDPCMSSLLPLNPEHAGYTLYVVDPARGGLDYPFADAGRAMEHPVLQTVSLDDLYADDTAPAPAPDMLSMDTQGSEYDLLEGATRVLAGVAALRLEVAFQPIYQGQKLFGDICNQATAAGFQFMTLLETCAMYPSREPVGLRAGAVDTFAEALFLRTPASVAATLDPALRYLRLLKAAFISLQFNQLEFALAYLRLLGPQPAGLQTALAQRAYPAFLLGLAARAAAHPRTFPPLFSEAYSFAESRARFAPGTAPPHLNTHLADIVTALRREVADLGGDRLCVMPFGLYARALAAPGTDAGDGAPLAFFDNSAGKHRAAGHMVHAPTELAPDDHVVILSPAYSRDLARQLEGLRGERHAHTLTWDDLQAGRRSFRRPDAAPTEVESWLEKHDFAALAARVRSLRLIQTPV